MGDYAATARSMAAASQGNLHAMGQSSMIWTAGCQKISHSIGTAAHTQVSQTLANWTKLSGARTVQEVVDLQADNARAFLGTAIADSGKLTEACIRLAERAMEPFSKHLAQTTEKSAHPAN
jgi:phasin family protein